MNIATLRLTGDDASLDEVVKKLDLRVTSRVIAGERRFRQGAHDKSGLSANIADLANPDALMEDVRAFIQKCLAHGPEVFPASIEAELALGIFVGSSVQFIGSVELRQTDIRDLAAIGIAFSVAAYPTTDEPSSNC